VSKKEKELTATIVGSDEWFADEGERSRSAEKRGTISFIGEKPSGIGYSCAGCGKESFLPIFRDGEKKPDPQAWRWNGSKDRPTLRPSLLSRCCGWHGYLTDGTFSEC
jgi:hypothetical protein